MSQRGKYIVVEGSDGIGKTTQTRDLLVPHLNSVGIIAHYAHEPGGTAMSEEIEHLVKARHLDRHAMTNLLLFTAARVEAWHTYIVPILEKGEWVIADRNWLSSVVYQGYAGGLGADVVYNLTKQALPSSYLYPDFTIMAHASKTHQLQLLKARGKSDQDYFESQNDRFQNNLRTGYERLTKESFVLKKDAFTSISFDGKPDIVHKRVWRAIASLVSSTP